MGREELLGVRGAAGVADLGHAATEPGVIDHDRDAALRRTHSGGGLRRRSQ